MMSLCGGCRHNGVASQSPARNVSLFQIRRGFRTRWSGMAFSVESDSDQWTLRVEDSGDHRMLYIAHRGGARAAQVAAAEFAIFRALGPDSRVSPDGLARELKWQEYW